jgi:hypothetical protein
VPEGLGGFGFGLGPDHHDLEFAASLFIHVPLLLDLLLVRFVLCVVEFVLLFNYCAE